jgi:putative transcriptional regulator
MNLAVTNRIKEIRTTQKHKQVDMAIAVGASTKTISNIERGYYPPSLETALRLACYLKVPVEDLFQLDEKTQELIQN